MFRIGIVRDDNGKFLEYCTITMFLLNPILKIFGFQIFSISQNNIFICHKLQKVNRNVNIVNNICEFWFHKNENYITENELNKLPLNQLVHFSGCVKKNNGSIEFYKEGIQHNDKGPSVITKSGEEFWFLEGKRHRLNGPAIVLNDGFGIHWVNGKYYSKKEFEMFTDLMKYKQE